MPTRKSDAPETTDTAAAGQPGGEPETAATPEERARAALTGERVTMTAAELDALLAGDAFTPDEQGEVRHLARQNRILVEDR